MEKNVYERYGLSSNPFRDIASETLDNIDIFHVSLEIDNKLKLVEEEIINKENSAVIAVLGDWGVGKTERLLMIHDEAKKKGYFNIYRNLTKETIWVISEILEEIIENTNLSFFTRYFSPPKCYRIITKTYKQINKGYDPEKLGEAIAKALNKNAPSFFLLNDLHNLEMSKDIDDFFNLLHIIIDNIEPGVLIMITSEKKYFNKIMHVKPSLNQRFNIKITLPRLKTNEASLLVAKRILGKRLVDDLDPLYPFTNDSLSLLNDYANGNPRYLLKLIDRIIDYASKRRVIQIDENVVRTVFNITDIGKIPDQLREGQSSIDSYSHPKKRVSKVTKHRSKKKKTNIKRTPLKKNRKKPKRLRTSSKRMNNKKVLRIKDDEIDLSNILLSEEPQGLIDSTGNFELIQQRQSTMVKVKKPKQDFFFNDKTF